jgi:hypothetical protein
MAARIIAERYAPGFDAAMPLLGWSMAKMARNALTGILVQDGTVKLGDRALLPQWRGDDDLSFPKIPSRLDSHRKTESSHD